MVLLLLLLAKSTLLERPPLLLKPPVECRFVVTLSEEGTRRTSDSECVLLMSSSSDMQLLLLRLRLIGVAARPAEALRLESLKKNNNNYEKYSGSAIEIGVTLSWLGSYSVDDCQELRSVKIKYRY